MELTITAKLVDESGKAMVNALVYVYAYTAKAAMTRIAYGRTDASGNLNVNTSHELVQTVQPRMMLRYYDAAKRSWRNLTNQVQSYTAASANFGVLSVRSAVAVKISSTGFYAVNSTLQSFASKSTDGEKTRLLGEVGSLTDDVDRLGREKTGLQSQVTELNRSKSSLEQRVTTLESSVAGKTTQIRSLSASLSRANTDKTALSHRLEQAVADKNSALESLRAEHAKQLDDKQKEVARLSAQVEEYEKASGAETNLHDLVLNTASQLETARTGIQRQGRHYRLGNISMKLKVTPGPTGAGFSFPAKDAIDEATTQALSEIAIDFPAEEETGAAQRQAVPAPRLIGYTEVVARRKTQPYGLDLDVAYQLVPDDESGAAMVGRVIRQLPEAGSGALEPGAVITVFIGKAIDQVSEH